MTLTLIKHKLPEVSDEQVKLFTAGHKRRAIRLYLKSNLKMPGSIYIRKEEARIILIYAASLKK